MQDWSECSIEDLKKAKKRALKDNDRLLQICHLDPEYMWEFHENKYILIELDDELDRRQVEKR